MRHYQMILASALLVAGACGWASAEAKGRVIILGFDGVDPGIAGQMMAAGELPNMSKLAEMGTFKPLGSSNPPQSPTAWSNFATCRTPVNHGVFDFLRRTPQNYMPGVGFGAAKRPDLLDDGTLKEKLEYISHRKGDSFWKVAGEQGFRVKSLIVPFAYPAEDLGEQGCQLCGLDAQDIRGTQSTYFAFSEEFDKQESMAGGVRLPLKFDGDAATVMTPGIAIPGSRTDYAEVPVKFTLDRAAKRLAIEVQGQKAELGTGDWSEWLEWTFEVSPKFSVRAISRFHVTAAESPVRLYMTCLQYHPREPMIPISHPDAYAGELADRYGLYKTIGWAYDTKALQQNDMTEDMFLEDVWRTMAWNEHLLLDEMTRSDFDLLLAGWTAPDRVSHMFWAYRDPKHPLYTPEMAAKYGRVVEDTYIRMDETVGKVLAKMKDTDLLMIMSDHGFHSFRYGFSVNTWLARNGYLAIKGQSDPATAFTEKRFLQDFDWPRTKAYALGLGMIFLNMKGREGQGIVDSKDAPALLEEMKEKLLALRDPKTGDKVLNAVYLTVNAQGLSAIDNPDIQLGYAEGYQTTKASASGAAPKEIIEPNLDKWSGEHASSDVAITPGILFANQKLADDPTLLDLGVTALTYLGARVPEEFEGKSLLP